MLHDQAPTIVGRSQLLPGTGLRDQRRPTLARTRTRAMKVLVLAGELERTSETSRTVLEPRGPILSRLTEREQDVLRLLAAGHASCEVAQRTSDSERTVKNLLHDVATKLNAKSRSQAVASAIREGLI
jgi:DNA-binding NarL/FixJ family response regulator